VADKSKKFSKFKKFEDIETLHCIWHPQGNHTMGDYRIFLDRYTRKGNKRDEKEDDQKKGEDNIEDKGFQQSKGTVAVIFAGISSSRSKHQDKLALRTIMVAEHEGYKIVKRVAKRAVSIANGQTYDGLYQRLGTKEGEKDIYRMARIRERKTRDINQIKCIKDGTDRLLVKDEEIKDR
jgi:hypothetical protein